jgi:hypothetical protein
MKDDGRLGAIADAQFADDMMDVQLDGAFGKV